MTSFPRGDLVSSESSVSVRWFRLVQSDAVVDRLIFMMSRKLPNFIRNPTSLVSWRIDYYYEVGGC